MLLQNQRPPERTFRSEVSFGDTLGLFFVQEHRGEIWIHDVGVAKPDVMKNQRTLRGSCDVRGLLETHSGFLSVQGRREETLFYDVHVVQPDAMIIKETR